MVTPFPLPGRPASGGVQAVASSLCDALATESGVELHVLVLGRDGSGESSWQRGQVSVSRVGYRQRMAALFGFSRAVRLVEAEVRRIQPDVVHAQGLGAEGVAVSRLKGIPKCVTPHGDVDRDVTGNVGGSWARFNAIVRRRLASSALSRFDVAVSISEVRDLSAARRVVSIANPLDLAYLSTSTANVPRHGVALVATVKRIKRIEMVIQALERVDSPSPVVLTIAGGVEDERYHAELLRLASICTRVVVRWIGSIDATALCDLYDRSAALVVASDWEVSPMCIAEAMVRRCPVVASDVPGNLAMVHPSRGRTFEAGDVDSLTEVLNDVLKEPSLELLSTDQAFEWAISRFSPARIASQTIQLYSDIVHDTAPAIMRRDPL